MADQDAMIRALTQTKSLEALRFLVSHGREVEFRANGDSCFISRRQGLVCLWQGEQQRQFDSVEALTRDTAFLSLWEQARVDTIF